jgi:hypothetical protein
LKWGFVPAELGSVYGTSREPGFAELGTLKAMSAF